MDIDSTADLIQRLELHGDTEATMRLTRFYAEARFGLKGDFAAHYCDGSNDGGIDLFHKEDSTYYIVQTKFSTAPKQQGYTDIVKELEKIQRTIEGPNPNKKSDEFVADLKKHLSSPDARLDIIWLTTNHVGSNAREEAERAITEWRRTKDYRAQADLVVVDNVSLDSLIQDVKYGYTPCTGTKVLRLDKGHWMKTDFDKTEVSAIVCTVGVNQLLDWFDSSDEIERYLQKNIRGFEGETKVNKGIRDSYVKDPSWFWHKHNGIIVFADAFKLDESTGELRLRNPQIVNGGQTVTTLFQAYHKNDRRESPAEIMLRVYRLPYEKIGTHHVGIGIISALNSQNKILASDLKASDPRQVRLERLFDSLDYRYHRKRSKEIKSAKRSITMRNLAIRFYVCKRQAPHEALAGGAERVFEENTKYEAVFPESALKKELYGNHIVLEHLSAWLLDQVLQKEARNRLAKSHREFFQYTRWFALAYLWKKLDEWRESNFDGDWHSWLRFMTDSFFEHALADLAVPILKIGRDIVPDDDEPRSFFKSPAGHKAYWQRAKKNPFSKRMNAAYSAFKSKEGA